MVTPVDYLEMPVRITKDAIYFGDEKVPGLIAQDVTVPAETVMQFESRRP